MPSPSAGQRDLCLCRQRDPLCPGLAQHLHRDPELPGAGPAAAASAMAAAGAGGGLGWGAGGGWGVHSVPGGRPWFEPTFCPQYVAELRLHPEKLNMSLEELPPALRQDNFSLPNGSVLLQQLDTIDNAACGWIQFMSKVGCASRRGSAGAQGPAPMMSLPPGERGHLQGLPGRGEHRQLHPQPGLPGQCHSVRQ